MGEDASVVQIERRGKLAHVRLNRPEALNASNPELHRALVACWPRLAGEPGIHAVVLSGNGRAFCAGGDLDLIERMAHDAEVRRENIAEAGQLVRAMIDFPVPIVAAVHGAAVGLGCTLATLADVVVMEESAHLADPHVSVGLVAGDGAAVVWPLLMSLQRAKHYLFSGARISAAEAREIGLVHEVVPEASALGRATELAERYAAQPRQALVDTKRALNRHLDAAAANVLDFALAAEEASSASAEHRSIVQQMQERARRKSRS